MMYLDHSQPTCCQSRCELVAEASSGGSGVWRLDGSMQMPDDLMRVLVLAVWMTDIHIDGFVAEAFQLSRASSAVSKILVPPHEHALSSKDTDVYFLFSIGQYEVEVAIPRSLAHNKPTSCFGVRSGLSKSRVPRLAWTEEKPIHLKRSCEDHPDRSTSVEFSSSMRWSQVREAKS